MVVEAAARHHEGRRRAQEPVVDVDLVRAQVHDRAAALALVPAPVAELVHRAEAVLLEAGVRDQVALGRAQVGRQRAVPLPVDGHDPPEQRGLPDQLLVAVEVARVAAALVPDLEQLPGLAGGRDHLARALERVRHLLLAVHVLARLQAIHRVRRVPEVGRRDHDRVELLLLVEHLAVVLVAADLELVLLERVHHAPLVELGPDVAHRPEAQAGDAEHGVEQHLPLGPRADEGYVDLLQVGGSSGPGGLGRLALLRLVGALLLQRVAEEAQGGDGGQPEQDVAPVELSFALAGAAFAGLLVFVRHRARPTGRAGRKPRPRRSG